MTDKQRDAIICAYSVLVGVTFQQAYDQVVRGLEMLDDEEVERRITIAHHLLGDTK